jgi:hypothetical protein
VSATRKIAKLEQLLVRIRARAAEPRSARRSLGPAVGPADTSVQAQIEEEEDDQPTLPPPPVVEAAVRASEQASPTLPQSDPRRDVLTDRDTGPDIEQQEEEFDDEPPVSSRRPVMPEPEERLAELAFGAEDPSPPRHSPPPESGRLPAAPDVSIEANEESRTQSSSRELVPEVMRAELSSRAEIIDVIGQAQRFAPSTFLDLLDASLSL